MDPVDAAFTTLKVLRGEIQEYEATLFTEQDARIKVIDRMLVEVLGWPLANISTEDPSGRRFLDYRCDVDGRARLVVEAKRDSRPLGVADRTAGRHFKLAGPVFREEAVKEGLEQAISYCGRKNAELACVTNGREWVVFRGSRCGDGRETTDGDAFVFPSLEGVEEEFVLFYDLLGYEPAKEMRFRAHFQEAEGEPIRTSRFRKSVRPPGTAPLLPGSAMTADVMRMMQSFFGRLTGDEDPDLVATCFVTSRESEKADQDLARIAESLLTRIQRMETAEGAALSDVLGRAAEGKRNEFVILVGTKGAGKSTFIDRFFRFVLKREVAKHCLLIRVNIAESEGGNEGVADWLNHRFLEEVESAIFSGEPPTFDQIRGVFFDEYTRLRRGAWAPLYEQDENKFRLEFGRHIDSRRETRPHEYIQGLIRHIVTSKKGIPVLVFDNADHFGTDFQERVYQYARSIYERKVCVVLLPITDRTSWELSKAGALQSFEHEALFLPTPSTGAILEKRVDFLQNKIEAEAKKERGEYFFGRGIRLDLSDLAGFAAALQHVLLDSARVSRWVGFLANHDVRRALEVTRELVTSPHLSVDDLIKAFLAKTPLAVPDWRLRRALIKGRYGWYAVGQHKFVQNIFSLDEVHIASPLLGLRILQMLRDAPRRGDKFISSDQIHDYLRGMGVEPRIALGWIDALLKMGLCLSYDPTITDAAVARRVRLSPSGHQHLMWGRRDHEYLGAMAEVTPITAEEDYDRLAGLFQRPRRETWADRLRVFVGHLLSEDRLWCRVPDHSAYRGQQRLGHTLAQAIGADLDRLEARR